jgi:MFS family permease
MSTRAAHNASAVLLGTSVAARLPVTMLGVGLLVHARELTGSFAAAGLVTGAYALGTGVGGPLLGRLVDGRGQTSVLLRSAFLTAALLLAIAVLPEGAPTTLLVGLAAGVGFATPPVGACVRALIPELAPDARTARKAFAFDATAVELTWISGPPLALVIGAVTSTGTAIAVAGGVVLAGTAAFAAHPASRGRRPMTAPARARGGSIAAAGMRTLVFAMAAIGTLFGAVEVGVTSATDALATTTAAGPLLGVWGLGSLIGGLIATRAGGGAQTGAGLASMVAALAAAHLLLVPAAGSVVAMAATLLVAGTLIAPTSATVYAMVERVSPAETVTEAFAWLATALAVGSAAGAAAAGPLADRLGASPAFAFAAGAGAVATVVVALRPGSLGLPRPLLAAEAC